MYSRISVEILGEHFFKKDIYHAQIVTSRAYSSILSTLFQILLSETNVPVNFKQKINIKSVANFKWAVFSPKNFFSCTNEMLLPKKSVSFITTVVSEYIQTHTYTYI